LRNFHVKSNTIHREQDICFRLFQRVDTRATAGTQGTRVINYPGNFLLPAATRVPEQTQITANLLNICAIFNRIYGIRISIYRILTHHQWILW